MSTRRGDGESSVVGEHKHYKQWGLHDIAGILEEVQESIFGQLGLSTKAPLVEDGGSAAVPPNMAAVEHRDSAALLVGTSYVQHWGLVDLPARSACGEGTALAGNGSGPPSGDLGGLGGHPSLPFQLVCIATWHKLCPYGLEST